MTEPTDRERLTILERAQLLHDSTLQRHGDMLDAHHERMDALQRTFDALKSTHDALLQLLQAQEMHLARLDVAIVAIKEMLERGHNGH